MTTTSLPATDHAIQRNTVRSDRLNRLAGINGAQKYLEIGVSKGKTLRRVSVAQKVAVDPTFRFDTAAPEFANVEFHEITSDAYFACTPHARFDLIYLDGLHTFEQTLRDFCATLAFAHNRTIWLIDDTVPTDVYAADRSMQRCFMLRDKFSVPERSWMGDVFKAVYAVHDFFPTFSLATFTGHGQTVVWQETRTDFEPLYNSLTAISQIDYCEFLETHDVIMNILDEDAVFARLAAAIAQRTPAAQPRRD